MGSGGFFLTYFSAGIFGYAGFVFHLRLVLMVDSNVLGGNFSLVGAPSMGASGAIFGTLAASVFLYSGHCFLLL